MRTQLIRDKIMACALSLTMIAGSLAGLSFGGVMKVSAASYKDSKVVHLSFENDVKDVTGNGNDGKLNNGGKYVDGVNGKALDLAGNTYVDLGKSATLQPEMLTLSMWVKANGQLNGEHILTWFKPSGNYQGKGWYLSCLDNNTPLKISVGEASGQPYEIFVSSDRSKFFPAGEWVHIAVTYNSETKEASIYRNGVAQDLVYINAPAKLTNDSTSNKYIGFNSPGYGGGYANVAIDEFAIYSEVASAGDVIDMYTEYGATFDFSDVVKADAAALSFTVRELKADLALPTEGKAGSTITWESSNEAVISTTGKVTRPAMGSGDAFVTLTATVSCKEFKETKSFDFVVKENYVFNTLEDFLLSDVQITDEYETNAFNLEIKYLKAYDLDRLLKGFRNMAGIASDAQLYPGWEDSAIKGHTMGHYLTALSQAYGTTKDPELLERINYLVKSLKECQAESGYLAAIPESHYAQLEQGNSAGTWVPWYTMHKILTGLIDAYTLAGNEEALDVASKLGDWVNSRTSKWSEDTQNKVLSIEYGGMNDCLYDLYKITKSEKHLQAAHSFDELSLFNPLYNGEDVLDGRHANTTIPKIIGALNRYIALGEGEEFYLQVAENFFTIVTEHHTYVTGGNSEWEHFGKAEILDAERTECNCETCNTYNMLKLARELFKLTGDSKYVDYYENTFINAILSSQNPTTGMTTYFQPMASGYFKVYSSEFNHFWCCTGSGMESFTKLNDSIYYKGNDSVYVIQYVDSVVTHTEANIKLTQDSNIPDTDVTKLTVNTLSGETTDATIYVRIPDWCAGDVTVKVNGKAVEAKATRGFVALNGPFNNGDVIEVKIPMKVVAYSLPDNEKVVAFKYGPIVLSASLGTDKMTTTTTGVNVTIPTKLVTINSTINITGDTIEGWLENVANNVVKTEGKLEFTLNGTNSKLVFTPHYKQHTDRYGIYFTLTSKATAGSVEEQKQILAQKEADRLSNVTIDSVPVSNDQYELQHNMLASNSSTGSFKGLMYRDAKAGGYFSYEMKVDSSVKNYLLVKYYSGDAGRTFKIYANDVVIADVTLQNVNPDNFYDVKYEIPQSVIEGKEKVTIKFETVGASFAGGIFDTLYIVKDYATNAGFSGISVNGKEATEIKSTTTFYVKESDTTAKIKFSLLDRYGLVYVNGVLINDAADYEVALKGKTTKLDVVVKAEDHKTEKTYSVLISKDDKKADANDDTVANKQPSNNTIWIVIAGVVVAIIGAVAVVLGLKKKNKKSDK